MRLARHSFSGASLIVICFAASLCHPAFAGIVNISSPKGGSTVTNTVPLAASADEGRAFHLEIWDNGNKLGNVFSNAVNTAYVLPAGPHVTTVLAVSNNGHVLDSKTTSYQVAASGTPGTVDIASPASGSTTINAVRVTATVDQSAASHLEIWDNGYKLGEVPSTSVNGVYVLPSGGHALTVEAIARDGSILSKRTVHYTVAEDCRDSPTAQCDLDQDGIDNIQGDCDPREEVAWIANPCGYGVQGNGGEDPKQTGIEAVTESGVLPNLKSLTLNGHSIHLWETQGSSPSNVLFRGQSPVPSTSVDSHWTLSEYVYLPDPAAHQAFELDAQYSIQGIWTKFYTECAFNMNRGTGFWAVFDTNTGGWIFLNGQTQNGQSTPVVPCDRSQFAQPWANSGNPSFTGWHHISWSFVRNEDGSVTYQSMTFDDKTTQLNFSPRSGTGGDVNNDGKFSALIQLDGVVNRDGRHNMVDAYVSEVSLSHAP